ncbi:hypothetical protein GCM10020254_60810 [Streptomyces goshikiensis]
MQIAVDPDPAGPLVQVRAAVPVVLQVGVEQTGRTAVEGERGGRHLAEFDLEGSGVGGEQLTESGVEHIEYLLGALFVRRLGNRHGGCLLVALVWIFC